MRRIFFFGSVAVHMFISSFNGCGKTPFSRVEEYTPYHPWLAMFVVSVAGVGYQFVRRAIEGKMREQLRSSRADLTTAEADLIFEMRKTDEVD